MRIRDITASDVEACLLDMERRGLSATSRRRFVQVLRLILDTAIRDELISKNVARQVSRPTENSGDATFYTKPELLKVLQAAQGNRLLPFVVFLAFTGVRPSEAIMT